MDTLSALWDAFAEGLMRVLPRSPFQQFISESGEIPFLGYLNWFFPVGGCIKVIIAWLGSIAAFYLYSIIMRWLRMLGG